MKLSPFFLLLFLFAIACQPKEQQTRQAQETRQDTGQATASAHSHHHATPSSSNESSSVAELQQQVMAIHDEVMPKMDDIMRLKRQLRKQTAAAEQTYTAYHIQAEGTVQELEAADNAMMSWMQTYDESLEGKTETDKMTFLKGEEEKITQVKKQMLQAISRASLLQTSTTSGKAIADTTKGSPARLLKGKLGSKAIEVQYYSPAVRGRVIWGGLVPFGQVWVTGAHTATSLTTIAPIKLAGQTLPAGKYALFTIPDKNEWTLIVNRNWQQHLTDEYDAKQDLLRVKIKPETTAFPVERLTYRLSSEEGKNGKLHMYWENVHLPIAVE